MPFELPVDHVVADRVEGGAAHEVLPIGEASGDSRSTPASSGDRFRTSRTSVVEGRIGDRFGVDIGPVTIKAYETFLADARTGVAQAAGTSVRDARRHTRSEGSHQALGQMIGSRRFR